MFQKHEFNQYNDKLCGGEETGDEIRVLEFPTRLIIKGSYGSGGRQQDDLIFSVHSLSPKYAYM